MKSIYLYIVGALIVVGVAVTPLIVKRNFTKSLTNQKEVLLKQGLELNIKSEEGYINGKTSFALRVVDGKKFRDYVLKEISSTSPDFVYMAKIIKKRSDKNIRQILDGTTLDGIIKHSNLYLGTTEVKLSLVKFSDEIMNSIEKDAEVKNLINPLLDEKVLTFLIDINSKHQITKISTKDIDQTFKLKNAKTLNFKLTGNKLNINQSKRMVGTYAIDNQFFKVSSAREKLSFQTQGFNYKFDYLNQFNSKGSVHIDSFKFDSKRRTKSVKLKLKNFDFKSSIGPNIVDTVAIDVSYALNDLYIKSQIKEFNLNKAKFDIAILGMQEQDLLDVSKLYNKITLNGKQISKQDIKTLRDGFLKIVNKGFKTNINLSLSGLKDKIIMLNSIKIVLHTNLKQNKAKMGRSSITELLNAFSIEGVVSLDKQDLKAISSINSKLNKLAKFAKVEAGKAIFNIEFKQGKLLVNKKSL
ncbi:MAG: hypothetical protein L3J44_01915 [Campylobacteraceae bacterium]|nr:hypothetical protein [Campylobacteraceae bacterium]